MVKEPPMSDISPSDEDTEDRDSLCPPCGEGWGKERGYNKAQEEGALKASS